MNMIPDDILTKPATVASSWATARLGERDPGSTPATPVGPNAAAPERVDLETLDAIQRRVLWLSSAIVDAANHGRPNASGLKVGGHQASSASMVSIMTSLWFAELTAADRISVKPHASPVLHAINYLLGDLDGSYLTTLRARGGLQSYPSRTKDPDTVDFSTGSVGIGATAPLWAAIAHRYVRSHFPQTPAPGRWISLLGDAELDEGAVWEAVADPQVSRLGELLWIVDLNRQSLDRVVPDIQIARLQGMFAAAGWEVLTCKWGRRLQALFNEPGGDDLRVRLESMSNEEYQRLLRTPDDQIHSRLLADNVNSTALKGLVDGLDGAGLAAAVRDLGGHDLQQLLNTYRAASAERPTVVFAYTIKGWGLPTEGHPNNHSALLSPSQMLELARDLGVDPADPWAPLPVGSEEAELCARTARHLARPVVATTAVPSLPTALGRRHKGTVSTQASLGRFLLDLRRAAPEVARRVVTLSPDVASSTNLGGWINQTGVWSVGERHDWFADDNERLLRWVEGTQGQHIELGIAETNLVGLVAELGATWSRSGQPLLPIATLYDPFVSRALEPWSFGIYAGGQSILVGTPAGVTLAPEGGAHQSITTPSIGLEQPGCTAWEPAFAQDLEWCMLAALGDIGKPGGTSAYFRLSTRPVDQGLAEHPDDELLLERRRRNAVAGGYRITPYDPTEHVTLVGVGAIMPEVLSARRRLVELGVNAGVVCLTSPDLIFRAFQRRTRGSKTGPDSSILETIFPRSRPTPLVTVLDGHPHTLAFLGAIRGDEIVCLGVTEFGQSADLDDSYALHGIDVRSIVEAALDLIKR
ncbi:pyruvate dehydrogenase [Planosporangium thailandense]|uniref:Pyruvate dehydrogenase E1 component n=2 Tax=Planosporangium thailandense TaxID=765197 RepID=A0ABX0Y4B4_9ACTN|nr:pyruvate dehydrogenase [Planosporangium thailandense]